VDGHPLRHPTLLGLGGILVLGRGELFGPLSLEQPAILRLPNALHPA
jgi:hypothetical protein